MVTFFKLSGKILQRLLGATVVVYYNGWRSQLL